MLFAEARLDELAFVVVDVETTGTDPRKHRVMELGSSVMLDGSIGDHFSSLVQTDQTIPPFVARMTGIKSHMLRRAPSAQQIFPRLHSLLSQPNAVFVGHNVEFDWSFVHQTFVRLGLPPIEPPRLCTYRLARRLLENKRKFNLAALSKHFACDDGKHHRAGDDARATATILSELLKLARDNHKIDTLAELLQLQRKRVSTTDTQPRSARSKSRRYLVNTLQKIPRRPGVYFYYSSKGEVLYIGKAKVLRERVAGYFRRGANHNGKVKDLVRRVSDIGWVETQTELSALLLESREIKRHQPRYNALIKRYGRHSFVRLSSDDAFPRLEWSEEIQVDGAEYFGPFRGRAVAEMIIEIVNRMFNLRECSEAIREDRQRTPCLFHQIDRCSAPCAGKQSREDYLREVERVRRFLNGRHEGIIQTLRERMHDHAEAMEFEEAGWLRDRISDVERMLFRREPISAAVHDNNVIIVAPTAGREHVEVFMVRHGRLQFQYVHPGSVDESDVERYVQRVYFDPDAMVEGHSESFAEIRKEVDEMRIIAAWLHRHRDVGRFVYINGQSPATLLNQLHDVIRCSLPVKHKGRS